MGSDGGSIGETQKQYRYLSSTYKANRRRYVFLLINGSLVRARAGEPLSFSKSIGYVDFRPETHGLLVFWSLDIGGIRRRSVGSRSIGRRFESSRAHHPFRYFSMACAGFRRGTRGLSVSGSIESGEFNSVNSRWYEVPSHQRVTEFTERMLLNRNSRCHKTYLAAAVTFAYNSWYLA